MEKSTRVIESEVLKHEVNMAVYGHYGFAMLLFPSTTDSFLENEENGIIPAIESYIEKGKCTVFSIDSVNYETWLDSEKTPEEKSKRHFEFNVHIVQEVLPTIFGVCGGPVPIIVTGADFGAFHAANHYFRRPDLFHGLIAMSGTYNIEHFSNGYFDENCYFNSPTHYLPNLNDEYWLSFLRSKHHVYLCTGNGKGEHPENLDHISEILKAKNIPFNPNYWSKEWGHDPETWAAMLVDILETKI